MIFSPHGERQHKLWLFQNHFISFFYCKQSSKRNENGLEEKGVKEMSWKIFSNHFCLWWVLQSARKLQNICLFASKQSKRVLSDGPVSKMFFFNLAARGRFRVYFLIVIVKLLLPKSHLIFRLWPITKNKMS